MLEAAVHYPRYFTRLIVEANSSHSYRREYIGHSSQKAYVAKPTLGRRQPSFPGATGYLTKADWIGGESLLISYRNPTDSSQRSNEVGQVVLPLSPWGMIHLPHRPELRTAIPPTSSATKTRTGY
ncbi:unnamed protein product [Dovyalis caffra]|uniref:Uncharacterized protein n=1 Tax=Dovyalis caffra TaxID=77055 RepID=A0AAV1R3T5_9ROSI|nr:unnamed protein product [Dovyalis caffra]